MHHDLVYESLFNCSRNVLEYLQPLSRSLHDMIVNSSNALPLRPIHHVRMNFSELEGHGMEIYVGDYEGYAWKPDYTATIYGRGHDFPETFRRLQYTCINTFSVGIRNSPFLRHWMRRKNAAFTVVDINFDLTDTKDYDLLDSIVNHLRPKTAGVLVDDSSSYVDDPHKNEGLKLVARGSFLNNLQTCRLWADTSFPPPTLFFKEPGYTNYELRCYHANVANGIDAFIESFIRDGCANRKLETVCIMWEDDDGPQSRAPRLLSKPTETDMPFLNISLKHQWIPAVCRVCPREVHYFVNTKQWMRMEVYKWTVEYDDFTGVPRTTSVLQFRVKDC
ncbi:hypothetical protein AAVH_23983 [Aphelenchoides avenae]|nr:hypothetical protein AAVH_23983 [Aphelenchus avenae]